MALSGKIPEVPLFDLQAPAGQRYGEYVTTTWGRELRFGVRLLMVIIPAWVAIWVWKTVDPTVYSDYSAIAKAGATLMPLIGPLFTAYFLAVAVVFSLPPRAWESGGCRLPRALMRVGALVSREAVSFYCAGAPVRPFSRARLLPGRLVVGEGEGEFVPWPSVGKVFLSGGRGMLVLATYRGGRPGGERRDVVVDVSGLGEGGVRELQSFLDSVLRLDCVRFDRGVSNGGRRRCPRWDPWDPRPRE